MGITGQTVSSNNQQGTGEYESLYEMVFVQISRNYNYISKSLKRNSKMWVYNIGYNNIRKVVVSGNLTTSDSEQ